jgi:hypothetical protein
LPIWIGEENIKEAFGDALKKAWDALPEDLFTWLIESKEERIKACIKANGWHTKLLGFPHISVLKWTGESELSKRAFQCAFQHAFQRNAHWNAHSGRTI